jgi:hypothetical protein
MPKVSERERIQALEQAPPVMVAGEVLGSRVGYELLVGFTRLGNLLGLLDREEVPQSQRHLVWIGRMSNL